MEAAKVIRSFRRRPDDKIMDYSVSPSSAPAKRSCSVRQWPCLAVTSPYSISNRLPRKKPSLVNKAYRLKRSSYHRPAQSFHVGRPQHRGVGTTVRGNKSRKILLVKLVWQRSRAAQGMKNSQEPTGLPREAEDILLSNLTKCICRKGNRLQAIDLLRES